MPPDRDLEAHDKPAVGAPEVELGPRVVVDSLAEAHHGAGLRPKRAHRVQAAQRLAECLQRRS